GSVNLFEGDGTTGPEDFWRPVLPALLNFLSQGRGALLVPPSSLPAQRHYERLAAFVPVPLLESRVRIVDYAGLSSEGPWHVPMAGLSRVRAVRAMVQAEFAIRGTPPAPFFEATALESLESGVGPDAAVRIFSYGFRRVREVGNLSVVWSRPGLRGASSAAGMSDTHLALGRNASGPTLRGIRPPFDARQLLWDESGPLRADLTLPG
ncbi:MAG TPA: hypothetical protein VJQ43_02620, partial [Thermoplasmata archaeon]|nr:hypothetical protein [Thermoplasmata archaeon]